MVMGRRGRGRRCCAFPCCAYSVLCVPFLCIPVLRAFVLGVWCICAAFSQILRHPLVNERMPLVNIAEVCRPVLYVSAVHA